MRKSGFSLTLPLRQATLFPREALLNSNRLLNELKSDALDHGLVLHSTRGAAQFCGRDASGQALACQLSEALNLFCGPSGVVLCERSFCHGPLQNDERRSYLWRSLPDPSNSGKQRNLQLSYRLTAAGQCV